MTCLAKTRNFLHAGERDHIGFDQICLNQRQKAAIGFDGSELGMRVARGLAGALLVVAIAVMALYLLRGPIASALVRQVMANAGLENPKATVDVLSLSGLRLKNVSAGPSGGEAFEFDNISVAYDWREAIAERRVVEIIAGPGNVRVALSPDGRVSLPGVALGGGEPSGGSLPFERLRLDEISLLVGTPAGDAKGRLNASYDLAAGGDAALDLAAENAGTDAIQFNGAKLRIEANLTSDGGLVVEGGFAGDVRSPVGPIDNLDIGFAADGASWRDVAEGQREAFSARAFVELRSASLTPDESEFLALVNAGGGVFMFGRHVSEISVGGRLGVDIDGTTIMLRLPQDEALAARTDTGAALLLTAINNAPLFSALGETRSASAAFEVTGASLTASGALEAKQEDGVWSFRSPAKIGDYDSDAVSFSTAAFILDGKATESGITAALEGSAEINHLSVGRLDVYDAPITASVGINADQQSKTITISQTGEDCIGVSSARLAIKQQDAAANVVDGKLCAEEKPIATVDWSGPPKFALEGELTAAQARYRLGQTRFAGRPPRIDLAAVYLPVDKTTEVSGSFSGGVVSLNETLVFSNAAGAYELSLTPEKLHGETRMARARIASTNRESPLIAPVIGNGVAELDDRNVTFSIGLATPDGYLLGEGKGEHNVETASGKMRFDFHDLAFAPDGLQPENLAPVLRGIIGTTTGAATGFSNFTWAPDPVGFGSSADLEFDNVTFQGPGITVTQTVGVSGAIRFSDLWPVTTDGLQTITVERIELGSLPLENGTIRFGISEGDTLNVEKAEFPWFGGQLGVYGASTSTRGGNAAARLEADNIDLAQILEFVDVDGLSGEGILSGVLPLVVEDSKARIENGELRSISPGAVRYKGQASDVAAGAGEQAEIAFGLLRNLEFDSLLVNIDGPLDGSMDFKMIFEGRGDVPVNQQNMLGALDQDNVRVPVKYTVNLEAALVDLFRQANLSRNPRVLIERAIIDDAEERN